MKVEIELTENEEQAVNYWLTHSLGSGVSPIEGETVDGFIRRLINQRLSFMVAKFNAITPQS